MSEYIVYNVRYDEAKCEVVGELHPTGETVILHWDIPTNQYVPSAGYQWGMAEKEELTRQLEEKKAAEADAAMLRSIEEILNRYITTQVCFEIPNWVGTGLIAHHLFALFKRLSKE